MKNVQRCTYLEKLKALKDQKLIKVITGVRRVGKSTLLLQFQEELKAMNPSVSIVSVNLDDPAMRSIAEKGWEELYTFISRQIVPSVQQYVFLDEIQNVAGFERLLEGLFILPGVDLYVAGSNAYLLSSELATLLTGRSFEINVLPFSWREYLEYTSDTSNLERQFARYLQVGGFPEALSLATVSDVYAGQYLQQVFNTIFENDISKRHRIYAEEAYHNVVRFFGRQCRLIGFSQQHRCFTHGRR